MLEFDDIQHMLLTRAPALTARYEFLSFVTGRRRAWVSAIKETCIRRGDAGDVDRTSAG